MNIVSETEVSRMSRSEKVKLLQFLIRDLGGEVEDTDDANLLIQAGKIVEKVSEVEE